MKKLIILYLVFTSLVCGDEKKILIISDSIAYPHGGVEQVIHQITQRLEQRDFTVKLFCSLDAPCIPSPYQNYRLVNPFGLRSHIAKIFDEFKPDHVLVALNGILGHIAGNYCYDNNIPFTLFYPTNLVEVCKMDFKIPKWLTQSYLRRILPKAQQILVPTQSIADNLHQITQLENISVWLHGVDTKRFVVYTDQQKQAFIENSPLKGKQRPFYLYVGRLSKDKNIQTFIDADLPGTKILVGFDAFGFTVDSLRKDYPHIVVPGPKAGDELVGYFASSDVFVFPSKTDTFGLVQIEALAAGIPVVAFNAPGPRDIIPKGCGVSYIAENTPEFNDLARLAWTERLSKKVTPEQCRKYAERFSWDEAVDQLLNSFNSSKK